MRINYIFDIIISNRNGEKDVGDRSSSISSNESTLDSGQMANSSTSERLNAASGGRFIIFSSIFVIRKYGPNLRDTKRYSIKPMHFNC